MAMDMADDSENAASSCDDQLVHHQIDFSLWKEEEDLLEEEEENLESNQLVEVVGRSGRLLQEAVGKES